MVHALVVRVNNERKSITLQYVPFTDMHSWEDICAECPLLTSVPSCLCALICRPVCWTSLHPFDFIRNLFTGLFVHL